MTLLVFLGSGVSSSLGSHRDASLRSDLTLVAGKKGDQFSAGNHLVALEVDEAPFDGGAVNVVSTHTSNGVGVGIGCGERHKTISPALTSAQDRSDGLRPLRRLRQAHSIVNMIFATHYDTHFHYAYCVSVLFIAII